MKLLKLPMLVIFLSFVMTIYGQTVIPFSDKRWVIEAQGQLMETFKGHNSLYLQNGIAYLKGEDFRNGIIEFDVFLSPRASFSGVIFRMRDINNYEEVYLRSHHSGNPDAYQYTPVFNNDPAWQLYHDPHDAVNDGFVHWKQRGKNSGYNTVIDYSFDRWMHVKLLVKGQQAELYVGNSNEPIAFIRNLHTGHPGGSLGVKSGAGAVWFANFQYTPDNSIVFKFKEDGYNVPTPPGTIGRWRVSNPFGETFLRDVIRLDDKWMSRLTWKPMDSEPTGLINLSRNAAVSDSTNTALARFVIHSEKEQVKKMDIGYSDRVRVFCNGVALYSGNAGFRTRDYRYLGTIGYFDAVYLPLKKGENEITLAVSETFGGWGLMGKFENKEGIQIKE